MSLEVNNGVSIPNHAEFGTNGVQGVELFTAAAKKFETTIAGATVTGALTTTDDVIVEGNITLVDKSSSEVGSILFGSGNDLQIFHDGANSFVSDSGLGDLILRSNSTAIIKSATTKIQAFGSSTDFVTISSSGSTFAGNVGIGLTSPERNLVINGASGNSILALQNDSTGVAASDGFQLQLVGTDVFAEVSFFFMPPPRS